ncbi:MAG: DUF4430 domain-containing protein, partial [Firmicutes bacterium]|nr:DUF4430 domain-containing protein [Bacillota bacterium]
MYGYSAKTLTLGKGTVYNAEKYNVSAYYTDDTGTEVCVAVNSGAQTALSNIPFDTNTVKIVVADKKNESVKTEYTLEVTRPRSTSKDIASSGIVFTPEGRTLWKDKYMNKSEGIMYVANADGSFAQYQGVNSSRLYYRTYAMNALEKFSLTLKGATVYTHIRYSIDNGETWTYLGQTGTAGVNTGSISIPEAVGEENAVVKIVIQILDDAAYAANIAAGKEGFADSTPKEYSLWVEQIPVVSAECDMVTATVSVGDWYPTFDKNRTGYRIVVPYGEEAPTLTYTVSKDAVVTIGDVKQTADAEGKHSLKLTKDVQKILVASSDGSASKEYSFGFSMNESEAYPDQVVDYLTINSQYINGNGGGYGISPQQVLTGGLLSLGNFGGYVTVYYEEGLTDDPNHKYGVDLWIDGNAFVDTSTGTKLGSMEPGQVWVSEDGIQWYALAGSEHYESDTLWDYEVTYTKTAAGGTKWTDNQGNTSDSTHGRAFDWPNSSIYTMNDLPAQSTITLNGVLLPCVDGTLNGRDSFNSFSSGARFGYVDVMVNGTENPYLNNDDYENESTGFDLAWAVDENGLPVDVSDKKFHYVKIVTASNLMAGAANEKSTEVSSVKRAEVQAAAVGKTKAPLGVTISGNGEDVKISFKEGKQIYSANLGEMKYISIQVNGASASDNIYINNQNVKAGETAEGFKITKEDGEKLIRIITQNGEKEPVIHLLKLTSTNDSTDLIEGVKVDVYGADRVAETKNGETYTMSVGHRIDEIGIEVVAESGVDLKVNGATVKETYTLDEGENTFTISATKNGVTQVVTLVVTKEAAPVSEKNITVYFKLLGDDHHGTPDGEKDTHTLKDNNLKIWISKKAYTVPDTATVLDVLILALEEAGLDYVNDGGNYISEIDGLGEFDNGNLSGWMYTLNGHHPNRGVMEKSVKNGDYIIFHYTDDYTIEEGSEGYDNSHLKDENGSKEETQKPSASVTPEASVNSKGEASVTIKKDELTEAVKEATKDNTAGTVVIAPEIKGDASKVIVELPKE